MICRMPTQVGVLVLTKAANAGSMVYDVWSKFLPAGRRAGRPRTAEMAGNFEECPITNNGGKPQRAPSWS